MASRDTARPRPDGRDAEPLHRVIERRTATASRILARAERLAELSNRIRALDSEWSAALRLANLRGATAVLYAEHASAAARARLHAHTIADCLARHGVRVEKLLIKVRPQRVL